MNKKLYFKNLLPFLLLQFVCMAALTVFLLINRLSPSAVAFILLIWCLVLSAGIFFSYLHRKHQLEALLRFTENLKERYLISEMMPVPERADDLIFYKILRLSNKSMLEQISQVHQERAEYREYIEQWVHEVKTPLAAMKLLCENEHSPASRRMLSEIEKTGHFIEQALYYTRMEHTEKDYSVREISLLSVIHQAIADNKYLLRQNNAAVSLDSEDALIFCDEKWLRFILNQLIVNAVKYRSQQAELCFSVSQSGENTVLSLSDNGIGIPADELPRVFEKGFTGSNGRKQQNSTGLGLYLCRQLCDKLGIQISVSSDTSADCHGSTFSIFFYQNNLILPHRR